MTIDPHSTSTEGTMARFTKLAALGLALLLATAVTAFAATPSTLQYQGRLTDNAGTPLNGAATVTFTIYSDSLGTATLWTETRAVTCTNGLFSLTLGTGTAIGAGVFNGVDRFLGIKVAPDVADMLPRQRIASTGFALRAATADQVTNAPGISNSSAGGSTYAANTASVVDSVDITIPADGCIYVYAYGSALVNHTAGTSSYSFWKIDEARFNTSTGPGFFLWQVSAGLPTYSGYYHSSAVSASRVYQKTAGTYRFYFNVTTNAESYLIEYPAITAMYFPGLYGTLTSPPPAPGLDGKRLDPAIATDGVIQKP
jgi:hypothetical protein